MKTSQILRNAKTATAQVFLSGGMLFALYYFLLREIGPTQLGIWSIVLATSSAVRLSELGLSAGVVRFVSKYSAQEDEVKAADVVQTAAVSIALSLAAILFLLYPLIGSVLRFFVPPEGHAQGMSLLPFACYSLWLGTVAGIFTSGLDGVFRTDIRSYLVTGGTAIHLALVFLIVPEYGLIGLGYSQVIQSTFLVVMSWLMLRREIRPLGFLPYRWNRSLFEEMFRYGLNIQAASIARMLFDPTTKMLLSKFGALEYVTYFEMANRMVRQFRALVVSAIQVLTPVFSTIFERTPERIADVYRRSHGILLFVALPLFSGIAAMIPIVSELWIGSFQHSFVTFAVFLTIGSFLNTLNAAAYFSNLGTGHLNWNTISHVSMGLLNAVFGTLLGYLFGSIGVVVGFLAAHVIGSAVIIVSYHARNCISFHEILPIKYFLLLGTSLVVPSIAWLAFFSWRESLGVILAALLAFLFATAALASAMWVNPTRIEVMDRLFVRNTAGRDSR